MNIDNFLNDLEKVYKKHNLFICSNQYGERVIRDKDHNIVSECPYFSNKEMQFKK